MSGGDGDIEAEARRLRMPVALLQTTDRHRAVEIWPDQAPTVAVFQDMLTQWRFGPAGPTGLDYAALPAVLNLRRIPRADRAEVFEGVKIMERAALAAIRE